MLLHCEVRRVFSTTNQSQIQATLPQLSPSPASSFGPVRPVGQVASIDFLSMLFETILDQLFPSQGLLLVSRLGHVIQSSPKARELCQVLQAGAGFASPADRVEWRDLWSLPTQIRTLCKSMIESREDFPNQRVQLHDEIDIEGQCCVHLTGDWVDWGEVEPTYLLISIENRQEVSAQRAAFDTYRYQLTARESDVWRLAMQGCSYSEIAAQLFISVNTVKRHMKSIHEKRRQ
ncbi:hypothetical protein C7293_07530 [filamentous cyanobacterium CCT1]|nr:hypothetical protein C7293_07530 [filamentous cyanobacterium CCT1]PSN76934.1 hypothetical protein C8B47_24705 [filamentous cyanobacterium CCP4]